MPFSTSTPIKSKDAFSGGLVVVHTLNFTQYYVHDIIILKLININIASQEYYFDREEVIQHVYYATAIYI